MTAADVIARLGLRPHPVEGGHFRETWRGGGAVLTVGGPRDAGTAIYYMLTGGAVSEMHRLPGAEVYHFYCGDPLETLLLHPGGGHTLHVLGSDLLAGDVPQLVIPGGVWQGSVRRAGPHGFALIGATMSPGFDYRDYETGRRADLAAGWPAAADMVAHRTPRDGA